MDYLKGIVLASVALEVAEYYPDDEKTQADMPRAEWRWNTIEKALQIVKDLDITINTEDIDEVVQNYLAQEEALS